MNYREYEILTEECCRYFVNNPNQSEDFSSKSGRKNRIMGISGYKHQIDVSIESFNVLYLVECKKWNKRISVSEYLTFLGRIKDIQSIEESNNRLVRGAIVTLNGWQSGVEIVHSPYKNEISLFQFSEMGEVSRRIHTAFLKAHFLVTMEMKAKIQAIEK